MKECSGLELVYPCCDLVASELFFCDGWSYWLEGVVSKMQQHQLVEGTSTAGREVQIRDDRVVPIARFLLFFPLKEKVAAHDVKKK